MSYFKEFPYLVYEIDGRREVVTDILIRLAFIDDVKNNVSAFSNYVITEGETPESLAAATYGSVFFYWVILLFNEIHDHNFEWPMSQQELTHYCESIYGKNGMNKVRYYEKNNLIVGEYLEFNKDDPDFIWVPPSNPNKLDIAIYPVTHYEHEERLNEKRRNIKLLVPALLQEVLKQFKESLK